MTRYAELADRLAALDAAALCDAARAAGATVGVIDPAIRRIAGGTKLIGAARLVVCDLDFLDVWKGLSEATAGEALLIAAASDRAVVGELFASEAARRGLAGIVVDGYCRDTDQLGQIDLPVYARGATPWAGFTDVARGAVETATVGGVVVTSGDLVFGDRDGVVVIPPALVRDLLPIAEAIQRTEAAMLETVARGGSIFDHTNLEEHYRLRRSGQPSTIEVRATPSPSGAPLSTEASSPQSDLAGGHGKSGVPKR